ncbi:UNVERIFIED_CONTAM: hypothetical protein K2H54_006975 [Gekko kuhli]
MYEREAVQKKTFTKWVNSHLARVTCRISDLYSDLRDGRMLLRLLEVLSGEQLQIRVRSIGLKTDSLDIPLHSAASARVEVEGKVVIGSDIWQR